MSAFSRSIRILVMGTSVALGIPFAASAQDTKALLQGQLQQAGETGAGYSATGASNPFALVTRIIQVLLSLMGLIFLFLTLYGGYIWMMARGDDSEVKRAVETIKAGVIGLGIILSAYIISYNVLAYLLRATGQNVTPF